MKKTSLIKEISFALLLKILLLSFIWWAFFSAPAPLDTHQFATHLFNLGDTP
jgi:hypothetical protein